MLLHQDHKAIVYAIAFSPDGTTVVSGARDGTLQVRENGGGPVALEMAGPKPSPVHAIAFLPDGAMVIGHALGWHVRRRDDAGCWRVTTLPSAGPTTAVAVVDGATLAVGSGDRLQSTAGLFELWDLKGERRILPFFREPNGARAVATCPAKKIVAWSTGHKKVTAWDIRTQSPAHFPTTHTSPAVALSPDGARLAAAVDWTVKLYDIAKKQERMTLKGHKGQVSTVAYSPDGATIATGSWDQTVRLWDAATGRERACFKWPVGKVFSLAYAPDGLRLAAGGDLGAVVLWDAE